MTDIFISYAREDEMRIQELVHAFEQQSWSIFWDRRIPAGKTWLSYIGQALSDARCVIVAWSHHSIISEWVIEEANDANDRGILVPVFLDPVRPPLGFRGIQAADLTEWKPGYSSPHFDQLIQDISGVVGGKPPAAAPEQELTLRPQPAAPLRPIAAPQALPTARLLKPAPSEDKLVEVPSDRTFTNSLGMKFVLLPAGAFVMGSPPDEEGREDDEKQHEVTISKPFYLQTTQVTQGQWKRIMNKNPSNFKECGDDCPVDTVSWDDAQAFVSKLNKVEGEKKYRVPTEAEWEYACRAGSTTRFCFGDDEVKLGEYGWYRDNSEGTTHPVGQKEPNAWGLYDMHGNVWEWCQDWYGAYPEGRVTDPKGPTSGDNRVMRGGSWYLSARYIRSALRDRCGPGYCFNIGFRLARDS